MTMSSRQRNSRQNKKKQLQGHCVPHLSVARLNNKLIMLCCCCSLILECQQEAGSLSQDTKTTTNITLQISVAKYSSPPEAHVNYLS